MLWLYLIMVAIALGVLALVLRRLDEVHSIAATAAGLISFTWGFVWAPSTVQLLLISAILLWAYTRLTPCDSQL
jgi:hypothetical protein